MDLNVVVVTSLISSTGTLGGKILFDWFTGGRSRTGPRAETVGEQSPSAFRENMRSTIESVLEEKFGPVMERQEKMVSAEGIEPSTY